MLRAPKITASKGLALMGAMLGASGPEVRAPQVQTQKTAMTRAQAIRANQAMGIEGGFHGFGGHSSYTTIHTSPAWNQRKARRASRQTGRKLQKRYAR